MENAPTRMDEPSPSLRDAARFWEPRRLAYNGILAAVLFFWIATSWPHFRPALTWQGVGFVLVMALGANLCYCAAYAVELGIQALLPQEAWRRFRRVLFVLGMLFAVLLESYWINDEVYPGVSEGPQGPFGGTDHMSHIASNMNFPAPLAALGFLAALGGLFVALAAALIFWFARKPKFARVIAIAVGTGAAAYCALLIGFSAGSHETVLIRGQEKYFCELDCHLAYSVVDLKAQAEGGTSDYVVTLRTRFDETTTSPSRPKDATVTPSPREVRLIDSSGQEYAPIATSGTSLMTPLKPADSYTTQIEFRVPKEAGGLRLLLNTTPGWPDHIVIGDENSWLHKKTYFAL